MGGLAAAAAMAVGCDGKMPGSQWLINGFLDPTQVGQFNENRRNPIRPTLGLLEEPKGIQNAVDPTDVDLQPDFSERRIAPGDVVEIAVFELTTPGATELLRFTIGNSGIETIPQLGPVKLTGVTARELELEIKDRLRAAEVLMDADVRVATIQAASQRFIAVGFLNAPGAFAIPRPDYRLMEAIAAVGGISDQVDKIYVGTYTQPGAAIMRPGEGSATPVSFTLSDMSNGPAGTTSMPATRPTAGDAKSGMVNEMEILDGGPTGPQKSVRWDEARQDWVEIPASGSTPAGGGDTAAKSAPAMTRPVQNAPSDGSAPLMPLPESGGSGANATPVAPPSAMPPANPPMQSVQPLGRPATGPTPGTMPAEGAERGPFESGMRVIEIPMKELLAFDQRYNIVIRPNDIIYVPQAELGEYYMMGHVARPGAYRFSGRPMTVKEAIASAGGFDALAWPSRADLVRRLSQYEEQIVQLDLDAIFAGNAPDFYMRPNDILNVGTNAAATFLAVARNAFRLSYGFGFVYDRNFADEDSFFAKEQLRSRKRSERQQLGLPLLR